MWLAATSPTHEEVKHENKIFKKRDCQVTISLFRSWGSGANPWGGPEKEDHFSKPNHWDGMLEVVGVTGVVHLGQIQSGLRSAMRIAQVSSGTERSACEVASRRALVLGGRLFACAMTIPCCYIAASSSSRRAATSKFTSTRIYQCR